LDKSLYSNYEVWKSWDNFFTFTPIQAAAFEHESYHAKIEGADVLEIGFGEGCFLAWAKSKNANISGTEINSVLINSAMKKGVRILPAEFELKSKEFESSFDTIIALDVFEHFEMAEIVTRLQACHIMLRNEGLLILRFPNGQSPLGLGPQHGDPTHITPLSKDKLSPFLDPTDWSEVSYAHSSAFGGGGIVRRLIRPLRYMVRKIIFKITRLVFGISYPLGPVVTLKLRAKK